MSNIFCDEQVYHPEGAIITADLGRHAIDWHIDPLQLPSDISSASPISLGYTMGSEINGPESALFTDLQSYPSAMNWPNQIDTLLSGSFSAKPPSQDSAAHSWKPSTHHSSEATLDRAHAAYIPYADHSVTLSECYLGQKPTTRSLNKSVMPTRTIVPCSHHAPYSHHPYNTEWDDLSTSLHQCHWNSPVPCSAVLAGTKRAIGRHLQDVHGIHLRADKTSQVCLWKDCWKVMRKESIPRHILAVHMRDKVQCPNCPSTFARPDSLQRHLKACTAKAENASEAL